MSRLQTPKVVYRIDRARRCRGTAMRNVTLMLLCVLALGCGDDAGADRPITELNGVAYGATCRESEDCGGEPDSCCTGGKCSPEGWCSPRCSSDRDCPSGFFCIDHSGSRCFNVCTDDRGCPVGFVCEEKSGHKTCRYK